MFDHSLYSSVKRSPFVDHVLLDNQNKVSEEITIEDNIEMMECNLKDHNEDMKLSNTDSNKLKDGKIHYNVFFWNIYIYSYISN